MAHGFAAEKTFLLPSYAERFAQRGLAVLLFDYRNLGESEGEPRNLVSHFRHLADWRAALAHARTLDDIDTSKIGLWGTSFSGGLVIVTAAQDQHVAAIVAQVPMVDVPGSLSRFGLMFSLTAVGHGVWDLAKSALTGKPHYVPVVAGPGRFAVLNQPGCEEGYWAIVPPGATFRNECPARVLLSSTFFRPIAWANRVRCPALIVLAEKDQCIPPATIRAAAARMQASEVVALDLDHFEHYGPAHFENVARLEADFLARHLLGS